MSRRARMACSPANASSVGAPVRCNTWSGVFPVNAVTFVCRRARGRAQSLRAVEQPGGFAKLGHAIVVASPGPIGEQSDVISRRYAIRGRLFNKSGGQRIRFDCATGHFVEYRQ